MKLVIELDFFADGLDEDDIDAVRDYVRTVIEDGAEVTCTTVSVDSIHSGEDYTVVSNDEIDSLNEDAEKLGALEAAGVDNWSGYSDAMRMLREGTEDY